MCGRRLDPSTFLDIGANSDADGLIDIWRRAFGPCFFASVDMRHVEAAFSAFTAWDESDFSYNSDDFRVAVTGAAMTVSRVILQQSDEQLPLIRRFAGFIHASNPVIAFCVVRQFEHHLSGLQIYISDQLIELCVNHDAPATPVCMSLRGMAFKILFDLDPQYKHWPQLAAARDQCIAGCNGWAAESSMRSDYYKSIGRRISRYINHGK